MARPATFIKESLEELQALGASASDEMQPRFAMLRCMLEHPDWTQGRIAEKLARSPRMIRRWWKEYREEGIAGWIRTPNGHTDARLVELRALLHSGEITSVQNLGRWLVSTADADELRDVACQLDGLPPEQEPDADRLYSDWAIVFLNALLVEGTANNWTESYRTALLRLLPGVDHVSLRVNLKCDLENPDRYQPEVEIAQPTDQSSHGVTRLAGNAPADHARSVLAEYRRRGFPFDEYQTPTPIVYYHGGTAFLGVLTLWRKRSRKGPVPPATLRMLERLRPFMEVLLAGLVARFVTADPVGAGFTVAIERLAQRFDLSPAEQQVVVQLSQGDKPTEAAVKLSMSIHTVRAHVQSVYRKAGVRNLLELLTRYLMPGSDIR